MSLVGPLFFGMDWAVTATLTLFGVQIAYKLATLIAVGPRNPVVTANLVIAAILAATICAYAFVA